jgi:6-hydroxycyclohex-1-ene-1-carbonyl-CoA dehydrogenase
MGQIPKELHAWQMVAPWGKDKETGKVIEGKFKKTTLPVPDIKQGEVLVEIAGCGVCHTDLGYFYEGVPTVSKPPLTLGHEISGTVVGGDERWIGKEVIIPGAMPCRQCLLCKIGRGNRCLSQKMPGASLDIYGGYASHIPVPSIDLCEVNHRGGIPLSHLAVIADAATTPYQACKKADLGPGDKAIVIGVGGVGQYVVQEAKALGAGTVVAIDIEVERLKKMLSYGADLTINAEGKSAKEIANEFRALQKKTNLPNYGWKIFEASGTKSGQEIGLSLLSFVGKLMIIGYGVQKVEYSLSRLMAFDAEIVGVWGCLPEYYPIVLNMALNKKIHLEPFVETRPMSTIAETFDEIHKSASPMRRIVLTPDF